MGTNFKWAAFFCALLGMLHLPGCATGHVTAAWKDYNHQAEIALKNHDLLEADRCYAKALLEAEQFGPGQKLSHTLGELAQTRFALKKYAEAEALAQRRVDMDSKIMLTNSLEFASEVIHLAEAQDAQMKFRAAEKNYLLSENIASQRLSSMFMGAYIARRARLYTMEGRFAEAEACFEDSRGRLETWAINQDPVSPQHAYVLMKTADVINDYGILCEKQKNYPKAEKLMEDSLFILEHQVGNENIRIVPGLNSLARISWEAKNISKANSTIRRSSAIVTKLLPPEDPLRIETLTLFSFIQEHQATN